MSEQTNKVSDNGRTSGAPQIKHTPLPKLQFKENILMDGHRLQIVTEEVFDYGYGLKEQRLVAACYLESEAKEIVRACNSWYDIELLKQRIAELEREQ